MIDIGTTQVNLFDLLVAAILIVSGLFAFARGFTREVLAIACWIGAVAVTALGFEYAAMPVRNLIEPQALADGIVSIVLFVVTLAVLTVLAHRISGSVRASSIGALDRTLGFFFGVLRGAMIVSAFYLLLSYVMPQHEHPHWVREAKTRPAVEMGAKLVFEIFPHLNVPEGLQDQTGFTLEQMMNASDALRGQSAGGGADTSPETGYKPEQRQQMEKLLEGTSP